MSNHLERLMCPVVRLEYDFGGRRGKLFMTEGDCCHMPGCIELFKRIDPAVREISTYSGDKPDTLYKEIDGEWRAFLRGRGRA